MIRPRHLLILTDLLLAFTSLLVAYVVRFYDFNSIEMLYEAGYTRLICFLLVVVISSYLFELYEVSRFVSRKFILQNSVLSALLAFFVLSALFYLLPLSQFGRGLLIIALTLFTTLQISLRLLHRNFSRATMFANRVLIIGTGKLAEKIGKIVPTDHNPHSYIGYVSCNSEHTAVDESRIIGEIENLKYHLHDYRPHTIIVALTERRGALPLKDIMHSKLRGIEVFDAPTYYEQQTGRLLVEDIQPSAFIYTHGFRMTQLMRSYKRILDVMFSSIGLLLVAPFLPFIALVIKLDSPGPIIYKQLRVGEREVEYFVYKFRTMRQDAESQTGAVWAQKDDPRVTKVGQFLRKSRIDEIPQLFNVLKGDMSFVGPRPERLAFVDRLKESIPYYSTRHFIKPGVTGWAQVRYPYGASDEDALEKLRYDLFYIKNYSIFLDFKIILDTVKVVTSGFGGR
jgi:sugar transferase (PEP-CTERM system associated)